LLFYCFFFVNRFKYARVDRTCFLMWPLSAPASPSAGLIGVQISEIYSKVAPVFLPGSIFTVD